MGRWHLRYVVAFVALAAAGLVAVGEGAAAREPYRMLSKSWSLDYSDGLDGSENAFCGIAAIYESGWSLVFHLDPDDQFSLIIFPPDRNLEMKSRDLASLSIDGRQIGKFGVEPMGSDMIKIGLPRTDRIVDGLKHGGQLAVGIFGITHRFPLTGTRDGLTRLERCAVEYLARAEDRQSAPPPTQQAPGVRQSASAKAPMVVMREPDEMITKSWILEKHHDTDTGKFTFCMIDAGYKSSRDVSFSLDLHENFEIYIIDQRWELATGSRVSVALSVDGRDIGEYELDALSGVAYAITLPYTDRLVETLKHGQQLTFRFAQTVLRFSLKGTLAGLSDLERCVAEGMQAADGTRGNPFSTKQRQASSAAAPAEERQTARVEGPSAQVRADRRRLFNAGADDDWAFINRLLDSVGLWNFEYRPRDEGKQDPMLYRWTNRSFEGGIILIRLENGTASDMIRNVIARRDKNCDDAFDHDIREAEMASGAKAWRVFGSCFRAGGREVVAFLTFAYEGTSVSVFNIGLEGDIDAIRDADDRLFGWFQATF